MLCCPGGDAAVPMRRHGRDTEEKVDWVSRAAGDRQTDRQTDARLYPAERHHLMPFGSQISPRPGSIFRSPAKQREAMPREGGGAVSSAH